MATRSFVWRVGAVRRGRRRLPTPAGLPKHAAAASGPPQRIPCGPCGASGVGFWWQFLQRQRPDSAGCWIPRSSCRQAPPRRRRCVSFGLAPFLCFFNRVLVFLPPQAQTLWICALPRRCRRPLTPLTRTPGRQRLSTRPKVQCFKSASPFCAAPVRKGRTARTRPVCPLVLPHPKALTHNHTQPP